MSIAADDLDDGLEYDVDYHSDGGEIIPITEETITKIEDSDEEVVEEQEKPSKKRKKNDKMQNKKKMKMEHDIEQKKKMSTEEPDMIIESLAAKIRYKYPDLSPLELAELYLNKSDFRSTAEFEKDRSLDNLPGFIIDRFKNMLPESKNKPAKKSKKPKKQQKEETDVVAERKFITILSMSALRSCDVHRATREMSGSSLKIISKNKLADDLKILKTTNSRVICSTPGRIEKILNETESPLKADELKILIIDSSYLDSKKQNIWDLKETLDILKKLTTNGSKLYLY